MIDSHGFWPFINGTIAIPPKNVLITLPDKYIKETENPDYADGERSHKLLKGWITSTLNEERWCYAAGMRTSYDLWMMLKKVVAQQLVEHEFSLQEELHTLKDKLFQVLKPISAGLRPFAMKYGLDWESST